ncbi:Rieske (2Fe-2S) protein [Chelatococcus asaccharovorans]|uniref:3-phenylpropionate/trans-cinnamate dioxygenase ferredoxin subunit n=1 Tax=Chelatococcus asaccharovorans TaxID=28210 RepID=A0A2V3UDV1_9HYPH|nr:Rieske (2Fe-2S) protein [Chelatococcus asaccharovorans]MBS7707250.1 Rieske (2Fe-2S) protein [Chelatococcus asaccharovorans]PXW63432.1 3-phenylpropionate/trans-cinnamate dioxygenase ferredoxin subunit [Chelatococcus asaccharovorans]CAH1651532.1 3-phenylpropionate/trans-cinnamate dioxygenase ferredoxin subunit [Chelatococcus asaccharovorans]CAH1692975.1 3-phenylpropionate/trans-cinnamate dioxygenase ferredoxin subunit [Chelatococcus asaccharovorans]
MTKHVVGRAADIAPGERMVVTLKGRPIVIFNLSGEYFGLLNRCPHQSADLSRGIATGIADSDEPGDAVCTRSGEFIRCPWHGWEFDIRTGQSWCDPSRIKVRPFTVRVEAGRALVEGPYKAEAIPVSVDGDYLIVDA